MKLLLDQNVSHRLVASLIQTFPDTTQVTLLGLGEADDRAIWELAQREGYAIVTHDADFEAYSVLAGGPPLVIWLRCGNQPKALILEKLMLHAEVIERAEEDPAVWCVEIY
jgi:predicted nuclease of predicted toxin-antitoxin system